MTTMREVEAHFTADASGGDVWLVESATVRSRLNRPYVVKVDLRIDSATGAQSLELLGSSAELRFGRGSLENSFSGIISMVRPLSMIDNWFRVCLTVEPALAVLRNGRDTRIFQEMTIPDILQEVLNEELGAYGRSVRVETQAFYPTREYVVQYQESHYHFVQRLMEEEGIVYYFEPGNPETLVLVDNKSQHLPTQSDAGPLLNYSEADEGTSGLEYVRAFGTRSKIEETKVATRHFDWTHPSVLIEDTNNQTPPFEHPQGAQHGPERESYQHDEQLTLYAYSFAYAEHNAAPQNLLRREQQARDAVTFEGRSTVTVLRHGQRFELNGCPDVSLNAPYVVVEQTHYLFGAVGEGRSSESEEERYHNRFTAVAADVQWRPRRTLPRPRIRGIQTAIVTGPAGEEIHTDEHGRVKCQFHWDRLGTMDDRSSCWIRVMQTWAGNGWGTWILPRIGMEVIVSFIDGDPDRPVVTGCLYNGDNRPPYSLPEQKTKSTWKSNSSLGGDGYNEFRFEDKKGDEEIYTHAQKDYNEVVEHDHNTLVHNCQTNTVDVNQTENIHQNQFLTVDINRTKNVGLNETTNIGQTRNETVGLDEFIMITQHRSKMVGANETVMVGQNRTESVGESEKVLVGSDRHIRVIGANQLEVNRHIHVTSDEKIMLRAGVSTILIKK